MTTAITLVVVLMALQCSLQPAKNKKNALRKTVKPTLQDCYSFLNKEIIKDVKERGFSNNKNYKEYVKCVYVFAGFMTNDGKINCDYMKAYIMKVIRPAEKAKALFEKCVTLADTPENTAYGMAKCFRMERERKKKCSKIKKEEED